MARASLPVPLEDLTRFLLLPPFAIDVLPRPLLESPAIKIILPTALTRKMSMPPLKMKCKDNMYLYG